jgi:DNA-binding transcriptional ArsR family regulator
LSVQDSTFGALANETRRDILARLTGGECSVGELADAYDMSLNAVSKHVKVLERAGLVRRTREGREHYIALDPEPIRRIADWASRYERFWSDRLDKLEAFLKANRKGD